jgi:nicotinamidase-related amidase
MRPPTSRSITRARARRVFVALALLGGAALSAATASAQAAPAARRASRAPMQGVDPRYLEKLTPQNATLIMVDYLTGFWPGLRTVDSVTYENNVTALAKIGQIFKLPTVILGDEGRFRGRFYPQLARHLPAAQRIERHAPSAWKEQAFRDALAKAARPKLIVAGISIDNCVTQTSLDLLRAGYEVYVVVDVSGSDTPLVEQAAMLRLTQAGAVMTNWVSLASELMDDWQRPEGATVGALYKQHSKWGGEGPPAAGAGGQ